MWIFCFLFEVWALNLPILVSPTAQRSAQYSAPQHSAAQRSAVQRSVQYSAAQHSVQYSAAQHSAVQYTIILDMCSVCSRGLTPGPMRRIYWGI